MKRIDLIRMFNSIKQYDDFMNKKVVIFNFPGIDKKIKYTGRDLLTVIKNMSNE